MVNLCVHFSDISAKADVTYSHLAVMENTSAMELIQDALQKLGIEVSGDIIA
jgi:Ras association (RalGDS/AF-6) domain